jgi:hypothetical protein
MPDVPPEIVKANCPDCGPERNAYVRGRHVVHSSEPNSPVSSSDTGMILECCGCRTLFFRRDFWFSEWDNIVQNPYTGQEELEIGVETRYWPSPVRRKSPTWLNQIAETDRTLGRLLTEMYAALNGDLRVLAAIGARTAFDRSSELLQIDPNLRFGAKLDELVSIGKIGKGERAILELLVDAGSAAAHRGWAPGADELDTMIEILEAFVNRAFILEHPVQKLKAAVPPKPTRKSEIPQC